MKVDFIIVDFVGIILIFGQGENKSRKFRSLRATENVCCPLLVEKESYWTLDIKLDRQRLDFVASRRFSLFFLCSD
jgi:hypothetical protein